MTEGQMPITAEPSVAACVSSTSPASSTSSISSASSTKAPVWDSEKNHGRYGASDYQGCARIKIACEDLKAGDACPECAAAHCQGKLYAIEPGILIRLEGRPLVEGKVYELEKLRCSLCGQQYGAKAPPNVADAPKYAPSCLSQIALGRYYFGLPFKRIERWQDLADIPLADGTQWDLMVKLKACVQPVYKLLLTLVPEGQLLFYDDTPNRILGHRKYVNPAESKGRKGIYSTAIVSQLGPWWIYLYCTSSRNAREKVVPLLQQRENPEAFMTMTDASASNLPREVEEDLLVKWILCFCMIHGRRKFWELYDRLSPEAEFVIEQIAQVYEHERQCQVLRLTRAERLKYHQEHSGPVLAALHLWMSNKLLFHEVEPNSALGQALQYMLKYWDKLTQFLRVAGAPLDNSLCERAIKIVIRHRKNSLFFRSVFGAEVGDCLMSIIHTAVMNGVNVLSYLNELQEQAEAVAKAPELWLPWHYQAQMAKAA